MKIVHTLAELRALSSPHQRRTFVPTMGNLHRGHLDLIDIAKQHGDQCVASIFVNRLQFLPHEDFDLYPRTLAQDAEKLHAQGCDVLFAPAETELYPQPQTFTVQPPGALADLLEGAFRPGFFTGVATVVMKLFACVQPQVAVFGQKDYQQLMVIRAMVAQFAWPVQILAGATRREPDGLAMSSRNGYLSAEERIQAVQLSLALQGLASAWRAGQSDVGALELAAMTQLRQTGWQPDYICLRRQSDLRAPSGTAAEPLVVLGAARLGQTRLIDNLEINPD